MKVELDLNQTFTTENGEALICFAKTDKFAFLCPYRLDDEETVILLIENTKVYSLKEGNTPIEAIAQLTVSTKPIEGGKK